MSGFFCIFAERDYNMRIGEVTSILKRNGDGSVSAVYLECCKGGCSCSGCYMSRFHIEDRRRFCAMHCDLESDVRFEFFLMRKL
jgi:hypothetical protein